jgi:hypothetical protein
VKTQPATPRVSIGNAIPCCRVVAVLGTAFGAPRQLSPRPRLRGLDYYAPGFIRYHPYGFIRLSFWLNYPLDSTANERLIKSKVEASRHPRPRVWNIGLPVCRLFGDDCLQYHYAIMIDLIKKLLAQGLPTILLVLGAVALTFGFFAISFSPLAVVLRPYAPLVAIAIVLIAVAVGLWLLDREKKIAAERYLDGHYNLIRFLVRFVEAHEHCMPENLSETLTGDATHSLSSHHA